MRLRALAFVLAISWMLPAAGLAATCQDPRGFDAWLDDIAREAARQGIAAHAIRAGLAGVTYDPAVVRHDRRQGVFRQSFDQFAASRINPRIAKARAMLQRHASTLSRIERQFGVPREIVVAIWGLETDFGVALGKMPAIRSVATLAYDCRRSEMFTGHLFSALRVVERGDIPLSQMRGAWAGEIGQTQFMPTSYYRFAVDFDGDGRRDLIRSVPDVLASTANYLRGYGWKPGSGWEPGEPNFEVLREWNRAQVYARTIARFATRLAGGR